MIYDGGFFTAYILAVSGVLGAVFGSFINCMAYRIAHKESVMKGRSRCTSCGHTLGAVDLVPVFSYIFLKGRCRYCGERISHRYMITELLMIFCFVAVVAKYDITFFALRYLVLVCILLALSLVDLEIYEIPNGLIIAGIIWWAVTLPLMGLPFGGSTFGGAASAESTFGELAYEGGLSVVEASFDGSVVLLQLKIGLIGAFAIGGGMLILSLLFDKVMKKESLGGGDVKLFFMTGLYLGPLQGLFSLIVACIVGILFVVIMKQKRIPFGPAISLAVFITLLVGNEAVGWYIGLF